MPSDELPPSLQESILAALIFTERGGASVATQVQTRHFDDTYREIAERVLDYRRRYHRPPGLTHLDDLFSRSLASNRMPKLRRVLFGLSELAEGLNEDYIVSQAQEFIREQQLKTSLIEANNRYEQGGAGLAPDIEGIFSNALRARTKALDAGTFLSDTKRVTRFFDQQANGVSLGIKQFDDLGVMLYPKRMLLYIGPKGTGKTWKCVNVGVNSLLQRQRVLHISLEVDEEELAQRYSMRMFAAGTRPDKFSRTTLEFARDSEADDEYRRLTGFRTRQVAPKWHFKQSGARRELTRRLKSWGTRLSRLVIKEFPSGQLTMQQLEGFMDYLHLEHKFVPTVLIVDYPDLMFQDVRNIRTSLGRTFVDLRGLASKRNVSLFVPTQGNRQTVRDGGKTTSADVTEAIDKVFTADNVITYRRTSAEKERGLARLEVAHARGAPDGTQVIITQSYHTGQYAISSAIMNSAYWEQLERETRRDDGEDDEDE